MRQNFLFAVLLIASLATTALIAVNVLAHRQDRQRLDPLQAGEVPVLGHAPPFALTDHNANPIDLDELRGRIWIADFIFTRCSGPCLAMTRRMSRLQKKLAEFSDEIRFLSVSVDPDHDSLQVLRQYADRHGIDTTTWRFATTPRTDLRRLVIEGFKLPLENTDNPQHAILHSDRFVLVDRESRIRGYYHGLAQTEPDGTVLPDEMEQLVGDVKKLLAEHVSSPTKTP